LERGESFTTIARSIDRAVSTVSREVAANGGRDGYRAWQAHRDAGQRAVAAPGRPPPPSRRRGARTRRAPPPPDVP
jgi:IS30 family transposase